MRLIRESGRSPAAVAQELDLTPSSVRQWVKQAEIDEGHGPPCVLTTAEREELSRLRRENRVLRQERGMLKNAAAGSTDHRNAA